MLRPNRLRQGDKVAIVSPSWGGPALFPHILDEGIRTLRERFRLDVIEMPSTRAAPTWLAAHPEARAADINRAFADDRVRAVFASIGGDDAIRVLPHLDDDLLRRNPKVVMGYSDTTALLVHLHRLGIVAFNGPSIMAGMSQLRALPPAFETHVRTMLFEAPDEYTYPRFEEYAEGYLPWANVENVGRVQPLRPERMGPTLVQGSGVVRGALFGGCFETLEMLKGSRHWPDESFWRDRIVFFESSEDAPPPAMIRRWLRSYGAQGVFAQASALLVGRARGYSDEQKLELHRVLADVVGVEFGCPSLPILANLDFGHTDPQWIVPLGVMAEVDCAARIVRLVERALV